MTADQRRRWLRVLRAEGDSRIASGQMRDPRDTLIAKLDEMAERMRDHWPPMTPEEEEASAAHLKAWFAERGMRIFD